jgi:hypothetical protein
MDQAVKEAVQPTQAERSAGARPVQAWLAERVAVHKQRRAEHRADRAAFAGLRVLGLAARHAAKRRRDHRADE